VHEVKVVDSNISKVIRTTRNDFALGTSKGVYFFKVYEDFTVEPVTSIPCLPGRDITELSEYAIDQFVVAAWHSNDLILVDRKAPSDDSQSLREPLWCNNLCTDLVPLPGYNPENFPFYLSKSLRSIKLINFKTKKVHTLLET
jgi:hypothetical protein